MPLIISAIVLFLAPWKSALPEEPLWSLMFTTLLLAASVLLAAKFRDGDTINRPTIGVSIFAGLAALSLLVQWLCVHRGAPVYLDTMLRGLLFWLAAAAAYWIAASSRNRIAIYITLLAIAAGATLAAGIGLQDYLIQVRFLHQPQYREFGTSLPDFFAGYLVMTFPIALALFLGAKNGKGHVFWLLYAVAFFFQFAVIPTTGSRFALISIAIGLAVFIIGIVVAVRAGMKFPAAAKMRLASLGLIVLLGGAVVAKPILLRLGTATMQAQAHSGDFRIWTWKGTARLIAAKPLLGAGPGMFVYAYPKRAITAFTEHAHNAYLQTASDIGIPALVLLVTVIVVLLFKGFANLGDKGYSDFLASLDRATNQAVQPKRNGRKSKATKAPVGEPSEINNQITLVDDRILVAGVLGAIAASMVQNLIDSDWFTFAGGITLFAMAGALTALLPWPKRHVLPIKLGYPVAALLLLFAVGGAALSIAEYLDSSGNIALAQQIDPLSSKYQTDAAIRIYVPAGDADHVQSSLISAAELNPDSVCYSRLAQFYSAQNNPVEELHAIDTGLTYDPNSVQLLLAGAQTAHQLGDRATSLRYYERMAALEISPYGTVRAIPEVSEARFADADVAIGGSLMRVGNGALAIPYYLRAEADCDEYVSTGGAKNAMRRLLNHSVVDKALDLHMQSIYTDTMNNLALAYAKEGDTRDADKTKLKLASGLNIFPGN
jgi:putative inorganic carbon (HCO3(-)) transporter